MAPTLVVAAVGALLAAALLGPAFDRRTLAVVAGAAALPSLDAAPSLVVHGATNAALHNVWLPVVAGAALYWDVEVRSDSWLRERYGWRGVRTAWVALAAFVVAGIGLALVTSGANLFYPLHDRFYALSGRLALSSTDGVVQTYVTIGDGWLGSGGPLLAVDSPGTTANYHVESWINPTPGTGLAVGVERRLVLVEEGWQAAVVLASALTVGARGLATDERSSASLGEPAERSDADASADDAEVA